MSSVLAGIVFRSPIPRSKSRPRKPPPEDSHPIWQIIKNRGDALMRYAASDVARYHRIVFLFVVAGGGPDPFAVFVGHRGAIVFVGIQPMEDQCLYDPLGI